MISKQFRVLVEDGKKYSFNSDSFAMILGKKKNEEKITLEDIYSKIADKTGYSTDAVKRWKLGCNGVSDVETVKMIAEVLNVDYQKLLRTVKDVSDIEMTNNEMKINVPEQNNALDCIYAAMLSYLKKYNSTWGFSVEYYETFDEIRDKRKEYYSEYQNVCNVVYSYAMKLEVSIYDKIILLLRDLELLIIPYDYDFCGPTYVPKIWTEGNEILK